MNCTECNKVDAMEPARGMIPVWVGGTVYEIEGPVLRCAHCGAVQFEASAVEQAEKVAAARVVADGVRDGAAFKFLRKELGYTAAELSALLDVAPETMSRWETGEREVPRTARALLALLWRDARAKSSATGEVLHALRAGRPLALAG